MPITIQLHNSANASSYVTWTPCACTLTSDSTTEQTILLKNAYTDRGGQLVFMATADAPRNNHLKITVPANGRSSFFISGRIDGDGRSYASVDDKDTIIEMMDTDGKVIGRKALMVRVRKDAEQLTDSERERFLGALVTLKNNQSYNQLQNVHLKNAKPEMHGRLCFLPWHRAYLLDLERKLQTINPSITIPYWNFDKKAPKLFSKNFIGEREDRDEKIVTFSEANPLMGLMPGFTGTIRRGYNWYPASQGIGPSEGNWMAKNETKLLNLGTVFSSFAKIESYHKNVHSSFKGFISLPETSTQDPLFFLMHANIDRLWAKWQWLNNRFDPSKTEVYTNRGKGNPQISGPLGEGDCADDTMWPWNGKTNNFSRIRLPYDYNFPDSPLTAVPGKAPDVKSMLDYQGNTSLMNNLHFAYDDVPFYRDASMDDYKRKINDGLERDTEDTRKALIVFFDPTEEITAKQKAFRSIGTFTSKENINQALTIFRDQNQDIILRKCSLLGLDHNITDEEEIIQELIRMLKSTNEKEKLIQTSFYTLKAKLFGSSSLTANLNSYTQALWSIVDANANSSLRMDAIEILASLDDPKTLKLLFASLENNDPGNPQLIKPEKAIQLLPGDIHENPYPLFRKLAQDKTTQSFVREEAVYRLSADANSTGMLQTILNDLQEDTHIRYAAARSLHVIQPTLLPGDIKKIFVSENEDFKLQTLLLNAISYAPDTRPLDIDSEFQNALLNIKKIKNIPEFDQLLDRYQINKTIS